jgi:hypothetical protein
MDRADETRVHMTIFANAKPKCALRKKLPHRTGNDSTICTGTVQITSHTLTPADTDPIQFLP